MKKMIVIGLLLLSLATFSQSSAVKEDYLKKSKNQKTAAWVLLSGGTVLIGTGFLIGDSKKSTFNDAGTGVIMGGLGLLSVLGSVPLFIASGKNKKKGLRVSFHNNETVPQLQKNGFVYQLMPSLSLKVNL